MDAVTLVAMPWPRHAIPFRKDSRECFRRNVGFHSARILAGLLVRGDSRYTSAKATRVILFFLLSWIHNLPFSFAAVDRHPLPVLCARPFSSFFLSPFSVAGSYYQSHRQYFPHNVHFSYLFSFAHFSFSFLFVITE